MSWSKNRERDRHSECKKDSHENDNRAKDEWISVLCPVQYEKHRQKKAADAAEKMDTSAGAESVEISGRKRALTLIAMCKSMPGSRLSNLQASAPSTVPSTNA